MKTLDHSFVRQNFYYTTVIEDKTTTTYYDDEDAITFTEGWPLACDHVEETDHVVGFLATGTGAYANTLICYSCARRRGLVW